MTTTEEYHEAMRQIIDYQKEQNKKAFAWDTLREYCVRKGLASFLDTMDIFMDQIEQEFADAEASE